MALIPERSTRWRHLRDPPPLFPVSRQFQVSLAFAVHFEPWRGVAFLVHGFTFSPPACLENLRVLFPNNRRGCRSDSQFFHFSHTKTNCELFPTKTQCARFWCVYVSVINREKCESSRAHFCEGKFPLLTNFTDFPAGGSASKVVRPLSKNFTGPLIPWFTTPRARGHDACWKKAGKNKFLRENGKIWPRILEREGRKVNTKKGCMKKERRSFHIKLRYKWNMILEQRTRTEK